MHKSLRAAVFAGLLGAGASAQAADPIAGANNQIWIETVSQRLTYHEPDNMGLTGTPWLDSEYNRDGGTRLGASWQGDDRHDGLYLSADAQWTSGGSRYDGFTQPPTPRHISVQSASKTADFRLRIGQALALSPRAQLTPYLQYGRHHWDRGQDTSQDYLETYDHHALGAGALYQLSPRRDLVIGADASVNRIVKAEAAVPADGLYFDLQNANLYSAALAADYQAAPGFHLRGGYEMVRFSYGASPLSATTYAMEPDSQTTTRTWRLGVGYAF